MSEQSKHLAVPTAELPAGAARSDLPFELPVRLGLPVAQAPALRATRISGPLRDAGGSFRLHFFGPAELLSVTAAGAPRPTLVLTQGRLSPRRRSRTASVEIAGGTVWIVASALGAGLPEDSYVGFTVGTGTLTVGGAAIAAAGSGAGAAGGATLTYTGALQADLDVTLGSSALAANDASDAGSACGADAAVVNPGLRIVWSSGGTPTLTLGAASATFAGTTFTLDPYVGPPSLDSGLGAIFFPFTINPETCDSASLSGATVTFSGTTTLTGGWALSLVQPTAAAPLGEALGAGQCVFYCQNAIRASWVGGASLALRDVKLVVRQGQLVLVAPQDAANGEASQRLSLWGVRPDPDGPRLPMTLRFGAAGVFAFVCDAGAGEAFYATCTVELALDRPVTLGGVPLLFGGSDRAFFGIERLAGTGATTVRVIAPARPSRQPPPPQIVALRNALVVVTPVAVATLEGGLTGDGWSVDSGVLTLTLGESGWVPTLPDPYVSNRSLAVDKGGLTAPGGVAPASILGLVTWATPPTPVVSFSGVLGAVAGSAAPATGDPTRPVQQDETQVRVPTQTAEGSLLPLPRLSTGPALATGTAATAAAAPPATAARREASFATQAAALVPVGRGRGLRLLDVSTNKDLLGVELGAAAGADLPTADSSFQLFALDVCTPAANLTVFTLPQVQWEPVRTLDRDQDLAHLGSFPTPLASVTDGGATQLAVRSVRLVPAIPDIAVDVLIEEFGAGMPTGMVTTLPFGLRAALALRSQESGGRAADTIARNQPSFLDPDLRGAAQIAFVAESGPSGRADSSHFDGSTLQLLNGVRLDTGAPLDISVLGSVVDPADSVESMFNDEFAAGGARASVPVTRLDICGYGGSTFSDWTYRDAAYDEAGKVQFQVVVGRTALEVVKFATVLYPWGIRLTRTVTVERLGGGGVIRRDSGWQASSPGLFQFPPSALPGTDYVVTPGLLRGLFSVRNIRSTGLAPITFLGKNGRPVVLAPKFFDAQARIDGLEGAADVGASGLLGFLQIEPVGEPLHEDDLQLLLQQQGPAGGPVDATVQVGGSGFRLRATRIEVDTAVGAGGRPELVGVVRSAPKFHQDGAWSAVRLPGPGNLQGDAEAVNANDVRGLPVVREGQLLGVHGDAMTLGPRTDYRFCDAADVHQPDNPVYEYGFLQTSPAHLFLFPRPYVDPGVRELRTRSSPRFADIYARCTTKGAFPPAANAITLPANALIVDPATGGFRLRDAVSLPSPRPPLVLANRGADVLQVDYSGATLSMAFDSKQWSLDLPGVELWTDILGFQKAAGLRTHLVAGTATRPVLRDIDQLFHPLLEDAFTLMPGFSERPQLGTVDLGATNDQYEFKVSIEAERSWTWPPDPSGPPAALTRPQLKFSIGDTAYIGWEVDGAPPAGGEADTFSIGLGCTGQLEGKIPIDPPLYLLLGAQLDFTGSSKLEDEFEVQLYFGFGITDGPFDGSASAHFDLTIDAGLDGGQVKIGLAVVVQAELDLGFMKVALQGELKGLCYHDTSHPPYTKASDMGGELEVDVDFAFVGVHVSYEWQTTKYI